MDHILMSLEIGNKEENIGNIGNKQKQWETENATKAMAELTSRRCGRSNCDISTDIRVQINYKEQNGKFKNLLF